MSGYLDTNVVVPLFVIESNSGSIATWLAGRRDGLFLGDLVVAEFNSALSRLVRQRHLTEERASDVRGQFDLWREDATEAVEHLPADIRAAGILVRSPHPRLLSADAIHLATCRRLNLTLITHDLDLQIIATREGIRWESPAETTNN